MRIYDINTSEATINFVFDYDAKVVSAIKKIAGSTWDGEFKVWTVPVNANTKTGIMNLIKNHYFHPKNQPLGGDVEYSYAIPKKRYDQLSKEIEELRLTFTARHYQIESLAFALDKGSMINGDDMGLGKTFESILYAEYTNSFPCIVIEPASVKYNWAKKWKEITGGRREIEVIESGKDNNWDAEVVIINYDLIASKKGTGATFNFPELKEKNWQLCILDEGHMLKNSKSQRSKIAAKIAKKSSATHLLTGTAVSNKPIELWNLLQIIDKTKTISYNWEDFIIRYCGGYRGRFGWYRDGATNTLELNEKLRDNCYIRREKSEVEDQLPPYSQRINDVEIDNRKRYEAALEDIVEYTRQEKGEEKADAAAEAQALVLLNELKKITIEGKLKQIKQHLNDWRDSGKGKLVVFGLTRDILKDLSETYKSPLLIGGVSSKNKQKIVENFVVSDDLFIFANILSAGTGIDGLQECSHNILVIELPWNPAHLAQAIARLHRSGQKKAVMVDYVLANDSIDTIMWDINAAKEIVISAINKGVDVMKQPGGLKNIIKKLKQLKSK